MAVEVFPLDAALGAEVRGVDLSRPLPPGDVEAIYAAWLDHLVLLFRGQSITDAQLIAFSRHFGDLEFPPTKLLNLKKGIEQKSEIPPEINVISNVKENGKPIGQLGAGEAAWHTDSGFVEQPPKGSLLYAIEIPEGAGNTSFLNMYAAYETLAQSVKERIAGRRGKHDPSYTSVGARRADFEELTVVRRSPGPLHPIVRTHPETGRKALYLGRRLNAYIDGLDVAESEELLDEIWAHTAQPEFVWEHSWKIGDLVMWDNRCAMHRREAFDDAVRRILHRTQLKGDRPY
ncbi:MAG: TauD/TfdA dioxygenase family protein [Alphaproteobacteria bacterium]